MARYLCELPANSPQKKALQIAFNKAASSGQNELADYLSKQLHSEKSPQHTVDAEMDTSSGTNHDPEMDNISEIDTLSDTGLEIDDNMTMDNSLTIESDPENEQESDMTHEPKVGIPLKSHGLFKVKRQLNLPSVSTDLVGTLTLE